MKRRLGLLLVGTLLGWTIVAYPALRLWGPEALVQSAVAMGLCLAPAAVTMVFLGRSLQRPPEQQLLAMVGGMGIRMVVVLGAGTLLYFAVPVLQSDGFWIWLLVFYLLTLALEVGIVLAL